MSNTQRICLHRLKATRINLRAPIFPHNLEGREEGGECSQTSPLLKILYETLRDQLLECVLHICS